MQIETEWFHEQIRGRGHTLTSLAKQLGMPTSAMSRMLAGERNMLVEDAAALSVALMLPIVDIIRHTGVEFYEGHRRTG